MVKAICGFKSYFIQRDHAIDALDFSSIQKDVVAICIVAYDVLSYVSDEYTRTTKKYSHGEHEMVCEGYSYNFLEIILKKPTYNFFG